MTTHASLLAAGQEVVRVSYHQFHILVDQEPLIDPPPLDAWAVDPLVVFGVDGLMIVKTGIHTGAVTVTAEAHSTEPSPDDSWEESTEVSVQVVPSDQRHGPVPVEARRGEMTVASMMDSGPFDLPVLNPGGPGPYRLRVSANHRDHNWDGTDEEPVEQYLIQMWPAPTGE